MLLCVLYAVLGMITCLTITKLGAIITLVFVYRCRYIFLILRGMCKVSFEKVVYSVCYDMFKFLVFFYVVAILCVDLL